MCFDPVTMGVMSAAIGVAQSVAQFAAQQQQAKAVEKNAIQAFENDQNQASLRQIQEADALAQKQKLQNLEEAEKVAEVEVSASTANVTGISVGNLVAGIRRRASTNRQTQFENTKMTVAQLQMEKKASRSNAQSRINSAPRPSALSLVAGIGGAMLDGYNTYDKMVA
ncbi:virion core protein, T7 gp14 family [Aminobacter sp. HY435]|uniref:virion core protein, T7 gp14 family n=1 Tax=Aminobacter sp. HY435 TaxID=2970917 RepID=UPI0022B96A41|nr:hypothetical protein [Aminobacter sp. HY435]